MGSSKRVTAAPQRGAKKQRNDAYGATKEQSRDPGASPLVALAGRTQDPEGVGAELVKLIGGNAVAAKKGVRKTAEVPPRFAIPDLIAIVKGPGSLSRELGRIQQRYPEVFTKERDRLRQSHGIGDPNWIPKCTVRFRNRAGGVNRNETPVATIYCLLDILLLLPGKASAELRSRIVDVFVRFVGGAAFAPPHVTPPPALYAGQPPCVTAQACSP